MKKFYINFITSSILYNQIYCTDSNVKIEKGKLNVRFKGGDYKNIEEINIDKNKEIDIDFIKDLVKEKKLKDNKEHLKLDKKGNYEIKFNDKKEKYYINDFLNKKVNGSTDGYYIKIQKYYKLPKGSKISVGGYSADLEGQKFYIDDFSFKNNLDFKKSVFINFKDLKLKNKKNEIIILKNLKHEDYYIDPKFYKKYKFNNKFSKDKFKIALDKNEELSILCHKARKYKIDSFKLDENLEKTYKIEKINKIKGQILNSYDTSTNAYQILNFLSKNFYSEIKAITVNGKNSNTDANLPINEDNINIKITEIDNKKLKNIVPKTAKININSKENIFIIDKKKYKSKILNFVKDKINTDTVISDYIDKIYITKTYPELKGHYDLKVENGKDDKFKDGTKITITIKDIIPNITTNKNQNKIYVKVNFEVSDNTKYKLKENILKLNNQELELEKDSKYEQLIDKVKEILEGTSFKDGFTVLYNNSKFTTGNKLTNDGIYTFKLNNEDTNFVEENEKEVPKEDEEEHKNDEEEHKEDDEKHKEDDEEHKNDDEEHKDINNLNNNINTNNGSSINDNDSNNDTKKSNNGCKCCDYNKKSEK